MNHIERMKTEHEELTTKVEALDVFIHSNEIFQSLDVLEQERMIMQLGFMQSYLHVLTMRLWVAGE